MQLVECLVGVYIKEWMGNPLISVADIQVDSRGVSRQSAFVAIKGFTQDGHAFIDQAIKNGAVAIVVENKPMHIQDHITYVIVGDSQQAAGCMMANLLEHPERQLELIGVTGTNGKTTVTTMLHYIHMELGIKSGLIGTVENRIGNEVILSTHTTPSIIELYQLLQQMVQAGVKRVFIECSSHAIHQKRLAGILFKGCVFTNLTRDHLDYHTSFEEYKEVKKQLFTYIQPWGFAISNIDDPVGEEMLEPIRHHNEHHTKETIQEIYYQLEFPKHPPIRKEMRHVGEMVENNIIKGIVLQLSDGITLHIPQIGKFNAYNIMAVYATCIALGIDKERVVNACKTLKGAEGRLERVQQVDDRLCLVDYAHTPDALANVLDTIATTKEEMQKIFTLIGCGGNRDKGKRAEMGMIACAKSDYVVFTSDNPRFENPLDILDDITSRLQGYKNFEVEANRKEAIKKVLEKSNVHDIVLIAGKGHEKYQEIGGEKFPFDDKVVVQTMYQYMLN